MSKKYIEADALTEKVIEVIEHIGQDKEGTPKLQEFVATCLLGLIGVLPAADVVEVVRCEDCAHYMTSQRCYSGSDIYHFCPEMGRYMAISDYCNYGERKDG